MKTLLTISLCCALSVAIISACQQNKPSEQVTPCTYPHRLTVAPECYTGNGLKLAAVEYGGSADGFEWKVIALKDTTKGWGWTPKDEKLDMLGISTFTVPDSLVSTYQGLLIRVATNCEGSLKYYYYSLAKSTSTANNCTTWRVRPN